MRPVLHDNMTTRPRVGISACLLGQPVRYDGAHKRDPFLVDTFGQFVDWVAVCPEVECGLGVPRESMHLEGAPAAPRLVTTRTRVDYTERMLRWAAARVKELEREDLSGFVFKSNSPSSGMERVRIFDDKGMPHKAGAGLFAGVLMKHFALLPCEEEGRLQDPVLRESFVERIFCLKRYRDFLKADGSVAGLSNFHADHKMLLMAHSPELGRELGRLVGRAADLSRRELTSRYEPLMLKTLALRATTAKHANVLQHLMGFLKRVIGPQEKQELLEVIDQYRRELVPLIVPITLLRHYARKYGDPYLNRQYYLNPHPIELKLRNHA